MLSVFQRFLVRSMPRSSVQRKGIVALELIFWLPIQIICIMAIIEFAIIMQVNRQVSFASHFGAKLSSEITRSTAAATNLGNFNLSGTPNNLKSQIDVYLANHGLTTSCEVRLEHNACVANPLQVHTTGFPCPCGPSGPATLPAGEPPSGEAYVRVTVAVKLLNNVPNVLSTFGFDITNYTVEHSTTFRIETNNSSPNSVITAPVQAIPAGLTANPNVTAVAVVSPPTPLLTITAPNTTPTGTTLTLNFNANSSSDAETAFSNLSLLWASSGFVLSPINTTNFSVQFTVPGINGGPTQTTNHTVDLTVTDSCGSVTTQTLNITLTRDP